MKKFLLIFSFLLCSCLLSYAQSQYITDDEKKVTNEEYGYAADAPNSVFIGKKWYLDEFTYLLFNANGTFKEVTIYTDKDYGEPIRVTYTLSGKWERRRGYRDVHLTYLANTQTYTPNPSDLKKFPLWKQNTIKQDWADEQKARRKKYYKNSYCSLVLHKITNDYLIANKRLPDDYYAYNLFSQNRLNEVQKRKQEAKKADEAKKAEEEKTRAEEEKIRAEEEKIRAEEEKKAAEENKKRIELVNLNTQAYKYAYEGKFDDAISTIEKAIEQQPNNANWYDSKGEILYLKGDKDGAKAMWEKVISVDPNFKNNASALNILINDKGWKFVKSDFPVYVPFKKIRAKKAPGVPGDYCCVFFTKEPGSNKSLQDTKYGINYYLSGIYNGENYYDKKIKKCTDVGDGWYEYEYSQYMYFSHYQKNAPKDCLQILIE